jgi:Thioredoxin like C-terminal domain/AhpC/TSA family
MRTWRRLTLGMVAAASPWLALFSFCQVDQNVRRAPDFGSGVVWLDEGAPVPHHISEYHGRVLLIDFWEYTCINCIRDFGVVKHWYGKYHAYGLDVIGVHYGEFAMGFDVGNVRAAAQRFRLPWPVVADQNGSTWKAYESKGWPERYLIDTEGKIVMSVFGEGNNRGMEEKIRDLLAPAHQEVAKLDLDPEENDFTRECGFTTQETFLGEIYGRSGVDDLGGHHVGDTADFIPQHSAPDGGVMLAGRWRIERDGITSQAHGSAAEMRYHARSLYAVLSAANAKHMRVNLFMDGTALPKDSAGSDVKFDGNGAYLDVAEARMYYLVRSPMFAAHLVALVPEGSGFMLHSFTFGNNCQLVDNP